MASATVMQLLIPAMWIGWGLYWWLSAYGVKPVRRRESFASRAAHVVPLIVAAALLSAPFLPGWLGGRWLPHSPAVYWIGVAAVAIGLAISIWARFVIGRNWSGTVTLKEDHEMVESGPYRHVRHPIYSGLLLAFLGSAVAWGEWRGLVALAIVSAALWRKLRLEERWLGEQFGSRYADYRSSTWALIPWVL
jgi:protein-S-isoprenylcysteine O-methyltransferase Ste14